MVKRTRRFLSSRGVRKFRRNRSAMVALGVIGLYFLLTVWIVATTVVDSIGNKVDALDLSGRPLLGLLLPEMTQARVASNELPGFGLEQGPRKRLEHSRFWYDLATKTMTAIDQIDPASGTTPESILEANAVDARGFIADPEEARAIYSRLDEAFDRLGALNSVDVKLAEVRGEIDRLRTQAEELGELDAKVAALLPVVASEQGLEAEDLLDADPADARDELEDARTALAAAAAAAGIDADDVDADASPELRELAGRVAKLDRLAELAQARVDIENRRELLGFALEDIGSLSASAAGVIEEVGLDAAPIRSLDLDPMAESATVLLDAALEPFTPLAELVDGPLWDAAVTESLLVIAREKSGELTGLIGGQVDRIEPIVAELFPKPVGFEGFMYDVKLLLGTDNQGRSILVRGLYAGKVAIQVGFLTALVAVIFGSLLGAAAAFFGGWVDHAVIWLYSTLSSVPHLVLLVVLSFMFFGTPLQGTLVPLYAAFMLTFWIGPCRVIRGETLKIKELEYVQAATAIGFDRLYILVRHVIPNTSHLMFINFSLLFIGAIKSEVILTFLGLGLAAGTGSSWGTMIAQSKAQVAGEFFWQIGSATFFMFVLVLAFNILTDALQDAFDPKHVS